MLATCYTRDDLTDYLRGQADEQLSGAIERHLDACPVCDETLAELETVDDSLIRSLRIRSESFAMDSPAPAWVQSLATAGVDNASSTAPADQPPADEPPDQLGDYELLEVLGRGGMSIVFAARHKHLHRDVALKVLLPTNQQQPLSRERFAQEMRTVGGLDHPAIVRATDAGECNDTLYLVMERVEGVDLNRVSRLEGPLRVADACAIGVATANALAHAHQAGIVHRDIKPSNVMLDRDGKIKLLDFGLARMQSGVGEVSLQTTMGQLLGTLDYMAPEQAGGHEVDWRADMYALGAMLFKLLTGVPPHGRSAEIPIIEFLNRLANRDAPRLDTHREALPHELVDLVSRLLQRDVAHRDLTASEVAERLQGFAGDEDLPQLAADAMHEAAQTKSPSPLSVKESLNEFLSSPQSMDSSHEQAAAVAFASGRPPRNTLGWIGVGTGLLSLLGLIVFGVVVSLKTPEGEIRIESELENVRVQVVDANEQIDVLTVDHGAAITTVRAGRYRVQLDSPSDRIEVTPKHLMVKQGQVVIAKVRQIPKADAALSGNSQRDPAVVVEAQEQLAETIEKLDSAKQAPQPNAAAIKALEQKLVRLRALTRPIPTEPVYQGRTLHDWVAQMRFEQEPKARKLAAENVVKLATTRPDAEAIALLFEAGAIQYAALDLTLAESIEIEFKRAWVSKTLAAATQPFLQLNQQLVASTLANEMQSEAQTRRDYAYWMCVDIRAPIRQGDWPQLVSTLHSQIQQETGRRRLAVQLVHAMCTADAEAAADLLAELDTQGASQAMFFALLAVVDERGLDVARDRQLQWAGEYLAQGDPSSIPVVCGNSAAVGPFRGAKWNDIDDALQADINTVVGPMLRVFEEKLAISAQRPTDWNAQQQTTAESDKLTDFIFSLNLTDEARERAVALLNQRLEQLLLFRANSSQAEVRYFDTPARAATAVQLLTGEVPAAMKQSVDNEAGYLAEKLHKSQAQIRSDRGQGVLYQLVDWYPFEVVEELQTYAQRNSGTSLKNISRSLTTSCLLFDWAQSSPQAAEFANGLAMIEAIVSVRDSHPQFAARVVDLMNTADNLAACELAYRIWSPGRHEQELHEKLRNWMKSGDATQARFAISEVLAGGRFRVELNIPPAWTSTMVTTLQRLGEQGELRATEMKCVLALKEQIPEASQYAVDYIRYWLTHPEEQSDSKDLGLRPCLSLLTAHPERVAEVREPILRFLETNNDPPDQRGHMILTLISRIQQTE